MSVCATYTPANMVIIVNHSMFYLNYIHNPFFPVVVQRELHPHSEHEHSSQCTATAARPLPESGRGHHPLWGGV